ncbi:MAG: LytR family transcriptional regulator [Actinobacteria bacterium]|nr:LytR family transcriptional regulator [Actinomycetota bacterium]
MTRPGGPPRGPEAGGAAAMSASRGGILIGVAVVVGILIFLVIGRGDPATVPATGGTTPGVTTPAGTTGGNGGTTATTVKGAKTTATTEAKKSTKAARANDQVVVQVLNGSGVQGAATQRSNDLKAKGYQVLPAGNAPSTRAGTAVQCATGYEKEAEVLVATLNELGVPSTVQPLASPLPAGFDASANCYVLLGK